MLTTHNPSLSLFKTIVFSQFMEPHITGVVTEAYSLIKVCKNPFEETEVSLWLIII